MDTSATATITMNSVTGDNIVNGTEAAGTVTLAGTVGGDAKSGDTVTLLVNGQTYTGTAGTGGVYSIAVAGSALASDSTVDASVVTTDTAGNVATGSTTHTHSVDTSATATITMNSVTGDNIVNGTEAAGTVTLAGTVGGDAKSGDTVTLLVNGQTYTGTAGTGGVYSIAVAGSALASDSTVDASVVGTDSVGNLATGSTTHTHSVDTVAPTITVSAPDSTSDRTPDITGTTNATSGSTVTVVVVDSASATQTLYATVQSNGTYTATPGTNLALGSYSTSVSVSDAAGNTGTASDPGSVVNIAPDTPNVSATGQEDTLITITLAGTDSDGSVASYLVKSLPSNGTLYLDAAKTQVAAIGSTTTGTLYFQPSSNYAGSASFTYSAVDNDGASDSTPGTASITVTPVADAVPASGFAVQVGADQPMTLSFSTLGSTLAGSSSYSYSNGITISTSGGAFSYSNGSLLGVGAPQSSGGGGIAGSSEAVNFSFPMDIEQVTMKLKNVANDTVKFTATLDPDSLQSTVSGTVTTSAATAFTGSGTTPNMTITMIYTDSSGTHTITASYPSNNNWSFDLSSVDLSSVTSVKIVAILDGDQFNQGGNTDANVAFTITSGGGMTAMSIAQDTANTYSASQNNDGFQIDTVSLSPNTSGTTVHRYPIDLSATIQDTSNSEVYVSLKLQDLPSDAVVTIVHADGTYDTVTPTGGVYDLSPYADLTSASNVLTTAVSSGVVSDKIYVTTTSTLASSWLPSVIVGVKDDPDVAYSVMGGTSASTLSGGTSNDFIAGGLGNDTLSGLGGADVFYWKLADAGTTATPATDTITDFDTTANSDALKLNDLLSGESYSGGTLTNYMHFTVSGGTTTVWISTTGGFTGGTFNSAKVDQVIVLTGVDLVTGYSTDAAIIQYLHNNGKLITD